MKTTHLIPALLAALALAVSAAVVSYTYDSAGRLVSADHGAGRSISYAYDSAGNLLQLSQPAPGIVVVSLVDDQLTLSWPASPAGFVLETSPSLDSGAVWTDMGVTPMQDGERLTVTVPLTGSARFCRLRKP